MSEKQIDIKTDSGKWQSYVVNEGGGKVYQKDAGFLRGTSYTEIGKADSTASAIDLAKSDAGSCTRVEIS
jgi:hypothetical protein